MEKKDLIIVNKAKISCPTKNSPSWNYHPKIYLNLEENQHKQCPYCGTSFVFKK